MLRGDAPAELVRTCGADDDGAGAPQGGDHRRVALAAPSGEHLRPVAAVGTGDVKQLLDADRHAVQRPAREVALGGDVEGLGFRLSPLGEHVDEGADLTVDLGDARQRLVDGFADRAGAHGSSSSTD